MPRLCTGFSPMSRGLLYRFISEVNLHRSGLDLVSFLCVDCLHVAVKLKILRSGTWYHGTENIPSLNTTIGATTQFPAFRNACIYYGYEASGPVNYTEHSEWSIN
jgi:hypothetical protein